MLIEHYSGPTATGITGVVLTRDGERLIRQCLASLSFCDVILVVDSGSTDATLSIARETGAVIHERAWEGFASQFTYAEEVVTTPWLFILDQDEVCPPALATLIMTAVKEASSTPSTDAPVAFSVGRKSWYFDRFLRHSGWYPDFILRVFRKGKVRFSQDAHIHYHPDGPSKKLTIPDAEIIHYPYTGFFHQVSKINVYAQQGGDHIRKQGGRGGVWAGTLHAFWRFIRIYFLKCGFLDGKAGFLVAVHGAFYAFSKYIRAIDVSWGEPFDMT